MTPAALLALFLASTLTSAPRAVYARGTAREENGGAAAPRAVYARGTARDENGRATALCSGRLASSDFPDPRLVAAVGRLFRPGGPPIRIIRDSTESRGGAYRAELRPDGVVVSAPEPEGAFRGLVEAAGACGAGRSASLHGAPGFHWRGVLEGFYGKPWTWAERRDLVDWMSRRRMNLFVIAPKDDPTLRADWRRPLSAEEKRELTRLASYARERFVEVAFSLSPGLDLEPKSEKDAAAARAKLEAAAAAGVSQFVIAFDDVDAAKSQVRWASRLARSLAATYPNAGWTFVPAEYWGEAAPSPYLTHMARSLDRRFRVGWTGGKILPRTVTREEARRFRAYARHSLVLGDNYPVQDRLWGAGRLQWGPLEGREAGLESFNEAYVANASPLAAASRLPLATAAAYAWDPAGYRPVEAWARAVETEFPGRPNAALFASCNAGSWLDSAGPPGVSAAGRLAGLAESYAALGRSPELEAEARRIAALRAGLDRELRSEPELRRQIEPWAAKLEVLARAVQKGFSAGAGFPEAAAAADARPGVVAGQALDRLLHWQLARARGLAPPDLRPVGFRIEAYSSGGPPAKLLLAAALDRLAGGPAALETAAGGRSRLWRDALPWVGMLSEASTRAREAVDGRGGLLPSWVEERLWRWRARRHFVAMAAARSLLEDFLARAEGKASGAPPAGLRAWLALMRRRAPDGLPASLAAALEARERGDSAPLKALFSELAALPGSVRAALPGQLAEEGGPWLDKVGEYGRLGLRALEGRASGGEWEEARYRLRSSNGLELVLELKLELDALRRWALSSPRKRPARPDHRLPADPRDLL